MHTLTRCLLTSALALAMLPACAQQPQAPASNAQQTQAPIATMSNAPAPQLVEGLPDFTRLVEEVGPGVVQITATLGGNHRQQNRRQMMPEEEMLPEIFRRMLPPGVLPDYPDMTTPRGMSSGSGFIISADGYVLTNHHVIDGASEVKVGLSDRREFSAQVIGSDAESDVALLKIDATGLPALRLGNSDTLKSGQWVVAIGAPFGMEQSVTAGVVSAVGRANPASGQRYVPFIQTDVAINRGNSGGPLLDTRGQVVGINSQIFSTTGGFMGVSFAIPIATAMNAAEQLRTGGSVRRGALGAEFQPQITAEMAQALGLPDTRGALVTHVMPDSGAQRGGLRQGDVIRRVNRQTINAFSDLPPIIGAMAPGTKVQLLVLRDGQERTLDVTLGELPSAAQAGNRQHPSAAPSGPSQNNPLGLQLQEPDAQTRRAAGLGSNEGVQITRVDGAAARAAGLRAGDIVLAIGREDVGSVQALERALNNTQPGQTVMLLVRRGGSNQFIAIQRDNG